LRLIRGRCRRWWQQRPWRNRRISPRLGSFTPWRDDPGRPDDHDGKEAERWRNRWLSWDLRLSLELHRKKDILIADVDRLLIHKLVIRLGIHDRDLARSRRRYVVPSDLTRKELVFFATDHFVIHHNCRLHDDYIADVVLVAEPSGR